MTNPRFEWINWRCICQTIGDAVRQTKTAFDCVLSTDEPKSAVVRQHPPRCHGQATHRASVCTRAVYAARPLPHTREGDIDRGEGLITDGGRDARPNGAVARDYITNQGLRKTGATCDSCDWRLTIKDVLEKIEESAYTDYSPEYIRRKFGSQAEGHAYFNRGHKICSTHLTVDEIEGALEGVDCYA